MIQYWNGCYNYNQQFESAIPNATSPVDFKFSFRRRFFGFITGTISEGANGIPEPAAVFGRIIEDKSVWFRKCYEHCWTVNPESGELYIFDTRKHVVHYAGVLENTSRIVGTWEIYSIRRRLNGVVYHIPRLTGGWSAEFH